MKVRIPEHREFVIDIDEKEPNYDECWDALNQILKDYQKTGGSVYSASYIEDNEEKVKALQEKYKFSYTIEVRK